MLLTQVGNRSLEKADLNCSGPEEDSHDSPVEIEENVVELFEEKEASCHALTTRYGVAFACTPPHLCKLCLHYFDLIEKTTSWKYCWAILRCSRDPFS